MSSGEGLLLLLLLLLMRLLPHPGPRQLQVSSLIVARTRLRFYRSTAARARHYCCDAACPPLSLTIRHAPHCIGTTDKLPSVVDRGQTDRVTIFADTNFYPNLQPLTYQLDF